MAEQAGAEAQQLPSDATEQATDAKERGEDLARETRDRAADLARDAQGRAGDVAREASNRGAKVVRTAQDQAGRVADAAQGRASDVVDKAREGAADVISKAQEKLGPQKDQAAEALDTAAERGWDAAHRLRDMDQRWLSQIVGLGAEELSGIAERVRNNDLSGLMEHLRTVAHRQPAIYAGASVAAGFALARMARFALEDSASGYRTGGTGDRGRMRENHETNATASTGPEQTYPGVRPNE